jgi:hypothetical protein
MNNKPQKTTNKEQMCATCDTELAETCCKRSVKFFVLFHVCIFAMKTTLIGERSARVV